MGEGQADADEQCSPATAASVGGRSPDHRPARRKRRRRTTSQPHSQHPLSREALYAEEVDELFRERQRREIRLKLFDLYKRFLDVTKSEVRRLFRRVAPPFHPPPATDFELALRVLFHDLAVFFVTGTEAAVNEGLPPLPVGPHASDALPKSSSVPQLLQEGQEGQEATRTLVGNFKGYMEGARLHTPDELDVAIVRVTREERLLRSVEEKERKLDLSDRRLHGVQCMLDKYRTRYQVCTRICL